MKNLGLAITVITVAILFIAAGIIATVLTWMGK